MSDRLTLGQWHERVSGLPPLLDLLAFDLYLEGRAPANAVAEGYRTLEALGRTGRTENRNRVPFRTQHAARDACIEWDALEFIYGARTSFPVDARLVLSLDEAADSMAKASSHEPVGKKALWKHKGWQLPAYIQHIANDLREKRGMNESRAIATAIAAVKRWAAGGGHVDPGTKAAAAKAVAEWEALKARAKGSRGAKGASRAARESMFVNATGRLKYVVAPMTGQATFSKRYANRLVVIEGVLGALRAKKPIAVQTAKQLLEAPDDVSIAELVERLSERKMLALVLMEALGYGSTPIRARTAEKGKGRFHGMHGVERAVRTRSHAKDDGDEHPVLAAISGGERLREAEMIAEAAPTLAPAAPVAANPLGSAAFEQLHPRASHGQFGAKPGQEDAAGQQAGAQSAGASALVRAIQQADPQFKSDYAATSAYAAANPAGGTAATLSLANDQIQSIGYANDTAGISQFQKDEGLPVTGKMDDATLGTVQTVYSQNARYSASRVPDFTGIKGPGARVSTTTERRLARGGAGSGRGTPAPAGRRTLGKTSAAKINEGFEDLREASILFSDRSGAPILTGPASGTNHANTGPEGGEETRQPGGDDFDFDEPPEMPPGLREGDGINRCATCVHFSPRGWVTSRNVRGGCMAHTWPVDRLDTCDDWLTLTPPDAPLRVFEARLQEAEDSGSGYEIVAARAALRAMRERLDYGGEPLPFHVASQWLLEALYALRIEERDIGADKRKALAKKGQTLKRGTSYPIESLGDLDNAIQAFGRAKPADRPALKRLLSKMARKLNAGAAVKSRIASLSVQEAVMGRRLYDEAKHPRGRGGEWARGAASPGERRPDVRVHLAHFTSPAHGRRVHQAHVNGMPVHQETEDESVARAHAEKAVDDYSLGRIAGVGQKRVEFSEWDGDKGENTVGPVTIPAGKGMAHVRSAKKQSG